MTRSPRRPARPWRRGVLGDLPPLAPSAAAPAGGASTRSPRPPRLPYVPHAPPTGPPLAPAGAPARPPTRDRAAAISTPRRPPTSDRRARRRCRPLQHVPASGRGRPLGRDGVADPRLARIRRPRHGRTDPRPATDPTPGSTTTRSPSSGCRSPRRPGAGRPDSCRRRVGMPSTPLGSRSRPTPRRRVRGRIHDPRATRTHGTRGPRPDAHPDPVAGDPPSPLAAMDVAEVSTSERGTHAVDLDLAGRRWSATRTPTTSGSTAPGRGRRRPHRRAAPGPPSADGGRPRLPGPDPMDRAQGARPTSRPGGARRDRRASRGSTPRRARACPRSPGR